jgi:hypothetical protein
MSPNCVDYMSRPDIQAARHVIVAPDEFRKRWDAEPTAGLLARADNICVSAGLPHFDPSYSAVSMRVLNNPRITLEMTGKVLYGSACSDRTRALPATALCAASKNHMLLSDRPERQQNCCPAEYR